MVKIATDYNRIPEIWGYFIVWYMIPKVTSKVMDVTHLLS